MRALIVQFEFIRPLVYNIVEQEILADSDMHLVETGDRLEALSRRSDVHLDPQFGTWTQY